MIEISGIYQIQSKCKPDRVYVGSAVNISNRWSVHLLGLKRGKHHSILLQRHTNKYGVSDLSFSVLEYCSKDLLVKIEQQYLSELNPFFNIAKIAGSPMLNKHHSAKTKKQMSKSHKGRKVWNEGLSSWNKGLTKETDLRVKKQSEAVIGRKHSKKHCINNGLSRRKSIIQLDMENTIIREWEGACVAEKELSLQNVNACLKGRARSCGGFRWKYKK